MYVRVNRRAARWAEQVKLRKKCRVKTVGVRKWISGRLEILSERVSYQDASFWHIVSGWQSSGATGTCRRRLKAARRRGADDSTSHHAPLP